VSSSQFLVWKSQFLQHPSPVMYIKRAHISAKRVLNPLAPSRAAFAPLTHAESVIGRKSFQVVSATAPVPFSVQSAVNKESGSIKIEPKQERWSLCFAPMTLICPAVRLRPRRRAHHGHQVLLVRPGRGAGGPGPS